MEPNERMRTMLSLMGGDDSAIPRNSHSVPSHNRVENTAASAPPESTAQVGRNPDETNVPGDNIGLDNDQMDEHVASYCNITGSDPESARHLLEVSDQFSSMNDGPQTERFKQILNLSPSLAHHN